MNKAETKAAIAVMQAFVDGKTIEVSSYFLASYINWLFYSMCIVFLFIWTSLAC